jgi:hypothetical protein
VVATSKISPWTGCPALRHTRSMNVTRCGRNPLSYTAERPKSRLLDQQYFA